MSVPISTIQTCARSASMKRSSEKLNFYVGFCASSSSDDLAKCLKLSKKNNFVLDRRSSAEL